MNTLAIKFCLAIIFLSLNALNSRDINKKELAEKVKTEFIHAWNGYKKYAWGHDDLKPLSKSFHDWYNESLLMSPIDAFDTMVLMGLNKEASQVKNLIFEKLSFDKDISVKNFEITIRLLGGLLSACELDGDRRFLDLAKDLANRLLPAYNSPTGMPYTYINLKTGKTKGHVTNPAEVGTSILEMGKLSKLTGDSIYYLKAKNALVQIYNRRSETGLVGYAIDIETGEWTDKTASVGCCIDSYYEYLLKGAILFDDNDLRMMWNNSINSINKYLADDNYDGLWYGHSDINTGKRTETLYGALDAYFAALLALSGDLKQAEKLQESNFKMWNLYSIEPEELDYSKMKVTQAGYELRPENIESACYLYHYTKDEKYLKMGETFLNDLVKYCRTESGYAALSNVRTKEKKDEMESFFFAETMKYLYLLFTDDVMDFNKVIFNTEAHPLLK